MFGKKSTLLNFGVVNSGENSKLFGVVWPLNFSVVSNGFGVTTLFVGVSFKGAGDVIPADKLEMGVRLLLRFISTDWFSIIGLSIGLLNFDKSDFNSVNAIIHPQLLVYITINCTRTFIYFTNNFTI